MVKKVTLRRHCSTKCSAAEPLNIRLYLCHFQWIELKYCMINLLVKRIKYMLKKSDPAALQYYMQRCRTSKH